VPEVAERGGAEALHAKHLEQRARLEPSARFEKRPVRHQRVHEKATGYRHRRHAQHHRLPCKRLAEPAQQVRQRRTEHERADQKPECLAEVALEPSRGDLHADGIDARKKEAGRKPRAQQQRNNPANHEDRRVARRAQQRTHQERGARRVAVRDRQQRKHQRAGDEPELHGRRHVAEGALGQPELRLQVGQHRIARKPERGARQLREHDHRQDAARCTDHAGKANTLRNGRG
jgi:hypothetical protein